MTFKARQRPLPNRLQLEQLEDRRVMATTAQLVRDINTSGSFNMGGSDPTGFVALGAQVLFSAATLENGRELWKSNGFAGGTTLVKDINPFGTSSNPQQLTRVGNQIYFIADDGTPGVELWKTNGTAAGTVLVKDLNPGTAIYRESVSCYGQTKCQYRPRLRMLQPDLFSTVLTPGRNFRLHRTFK